MNRENLKTEEEWVDAWTGYPGDAEQLMYAASKVGDTELAKLAKNALAALEAYEAHLKKIGFEWG